MLSDFKNEGERGSPGEKKGDLVFSRKSGFDHFVIFDVLQWRGGGRGRLGAKIELSRYREKSCF